MTTGASIGKDLVHRYYERFLSSPGELDLADEIFTPDIQFHNPISPAGIHGIAEYKAFAERWYRGFPDRRFIVEETVAEGDLVAARFTIVGTHLGEFSGAAPTGNPIRVRGMNIFRIAGGRIQDVQAFFNAAELYQPLGLPVPPVPPAPPVGAG